MSKRPLKILQVGSGFPGWGGTELHLLNLAEQLTHRGHDVTVSARPGKFVEEQATKRGLSTLAATVNRQWDWHDAATLRAWIRTHRPDVVHVHWSTDYVVTPWIARRSDVPVIVMSRHSPYALKSTLGRVLYDRILFDRIVALSESVRRTLVDQGLRPQRVVTIHHGTDTAAFRATTQPIAAVRAAWGIPDGATVIGMAGRIAPEKGVLTFLEAIARLTDRPIHAVLIGEGPQESEARALVAERGLTGRVTFGGFRADINNAIHALDVLVLASVWEEPCSAVVQQAMALGKPVIGTDLGGTPEMIEDQKTGLLIPARDPLALAEAIARLVDAPEMRGRMGAAGIERVEAHFTLAHMVDRNEALYQEILAAHAARLRASLSAR
jgi:glycosyltransferase involved in cell wall biosynthesis